jgi:hypothetical protein
MHKARKRCYKDAPSGAVQFVAVTNSWIAPLTSSGLALSGASAGDFAHPCGTSVAARMSRAISVTFTPTATGGRNASLNIPSGARVRNHSYGSYDGNSHSIALMPTVRW